MDLKIFFFFILYVNIVVVKSQNLYHIVSEELIKSALDDNSQCSKDLKNYANALTSYKLWALSMFDATSKLQPGLTHGNLADLGDFDKCISIKKDENEEQITGKYCLGQMTLITPQNRILQKNFNKKISIVNFYKQPLNDKDSSSNNFRTSKANAEPKLSWMWSVCVPDSCNENQTSINVNKLLKSANLPLILTGAMTSGKIHCQTQDEINKPLDDAAIIAITIFGIILSLMIVQTIYDVILYYRVEEPIHGLAIAFSVFSNWQKLIRVVKREEQLNCLDGIRCISIMWVVYGHRVSASLTTFNLINTADLLTWINNLYTMYLSSATLSVDTFFVIGGLLVSYGFMRATSRSGGKKFNIFLFYIHRYLRLTPAVAALVLFMACLSPYVTNGPDYPTFIENYSDPCKKYWWSTILYIQNYATVNEGACIMHTWYLNVDFQLFLLSPILLIPLRKYPKLTLSAALILALCSMGAAGYVAYTEKLTALLTNLSTNELTYMLDYYMKTHTRAAPWLFGFILGYFIYKIKNAEMRLKMSKPVVLLMWILSLGLMLTCIFIGHGMQGADKALAENVAHIVLQRPLWGVGICGIILICITGHGGPINTFLSCSIFQILNRFTYSLYIVHVVYVYGSAYARRYNIYFSDYTMAFHFWGDFAFCFAIAIIWTLAFESPIIILEKYLFGGLEKPKTKLKPEEILTP